MTALAHVRDELAGEWRPTLALAGPVVVGHLGMNLMSIVDTLYVGTLGANALGAVGVGSSVLGVAFLIGIGLLLGVDRQVAVAHGAGRSDDVARAHLHGIALALVVSLPLVAGVLFVGGYLHVFGVAPALIPAARAWLTPCAWSLVPSLVFMAVRQSLQALHDTRAATAILLLANVVNAFFNVALIHGRYGFPAHGVAGSGEATVIARSFTAVTLLAWSAWRGPELRGVGWRLHGPTLRELLRLGVPASVHLLFEGGVFSLVTMLCARLGTTPAAAHQVVLQIASFTFMVPLGIGAAGAVRVGNALGRDDLLAARRAGWSAVAMAAAFMVLSGVTLLLASGPILACFDLDADTARLARTLLVCAALFQLFDGSQVSLAGVLRGSGDTLASMVVNVLGHWFVGLPVGCALAFGAGFGAVGLWAGIAAGLGTVAIALAAWWTRRIGRIVRREIRATPG